MRISPLCITLTLSVLAACSTPPKATEPAAPPAPAAPVVPPTKAAPATPAVDDAQALAAKLRQQVADLDSKSVFFDFDSFVVKPEYDATLHAQADFLKAHPGSRLTVQGNTDERGGSEYNLALGTKRAEAVRKQLGLLGVSTDRIEATSFGKEKPRATCHDESCWSQNRRDDFVNKP